MRERVLPKQYTLFFFSFLCVFVVAFGLRPSATYAQTTLAAIRPPLLKEWEFDSKDQVDSTFPAGKDRIAVGTFNSYGVVDARTGKALWIKSFADPLFGATLAYEGNFLYALIGKGKLVACDPQTGTTRWSLPLRGYAARSTLYRGKMFLSLQGGEFSAIDLRTHRVLWTHSLLSSAVLAAPVIPAANDAPPDAPPASIVSDASKERDQEVIIAPQVLRDVIVAGQGSSVVAFNATRGIPLWRHTFPRMKQDNDISPVASLCNDGERLYCLRKNGDVDAFDLRTGRSLWHDDQPYFDGYYSSSQRVGSALVTVASDGFVRARECRSGRLLWSRELARGEYPSISAPLLTQGTNALVADPQNIRQINLASGKVHWTYDLDQGTLNPTTCYRIGNRLIIATSGGLLCFREEKPAPLPTEPAARLTQARRLAAQFFTLSHGSERYLSRTDDIKRALAKFGSEGFDALLPYLQSTAVKAAQTTKATRREDNVTFTDIAQAVATVMCPKNVKQTQLVLDLVTRLPRAGSGDSLRSYNNIHSELVKLLAEHGNENLILPILFQEVDQFDGENRFNGFYAALARLCQSPNPRSVHYLIRKMNDPTAPPTVRSSAYCNLARIGGKEGVAAVLAVRNQPEGRMPTLRTLMELDKLPLVVKAKTDRTEDGAPAKLLAVHFDATGTTWGLVATPVLGSFGDIWVVPRNAEGRWGNPIFTGLDTNTEDEHSPSHGRKPFSYQGKTLQQLIDTGDWAVTLAHDPALTRDTDGDGWTDLIEQRLGTNPNRADTDGDGEIDSQGRNPCGARPPHGEAEAILAAAFDAQMQFPDERSVAPLIVTFPKGTTPFRLTGYHVILIGSASDDNGIRAHAELESLYGGGVGVANFCVSSSAISSPEIGRRNDNGRASDLIVWNTSRTEATVGVRISHGIANGSICEIRLRKIEGQWLVIGSKLTVTY